MGVTAREQQMLDLYEQQGFGIPRIAATMGIKEASVRRTLGMLSHSPGADRRHEKQMECGSRDLLLAIRATGRTH